MFYRAKTSLGSGLGIYVKETLEKRTITLKSKENKGTKFIIQFPNQNK
jgi:signal transduction histidine kinase